MSENERGDAAEKGVKVDEAGAAPNTLTIIMEKLQQIEAMCITNRADISKVTKQIGIGVEDRPQAGSSPQDDADEDHSVNASDFQEVESVVDVAEISRIKKIYDLPRFDGQAQDWPLFYANYKDTTRMFAYSNRENLIRLQKCLTGPAREAVMSMLIHPSDVPNTVEELEFRFGRPELIVKDQLAKLQQLPAFGESKLDQIVPFSTKVRNTVSLLKAAKSDHYLCDVMTLESLVLKIPHSKQYEWVQYTKELEGYPTIETFSEWLSSVARVVCKLPIAPEKTPHNKPKVVMHVHENDTSPPKSVCPDCRGQHKLHQCENYKAINNIADRWKLVKALKLCFSCLNKGHATANCRIKKDCRINGCNRQHHSSLHEDKRPPPPPPTIMPNQQLYTYRASSSDQLFKILPVTLCGPNGQHKTFAIFDEGSSISIIEEQVASLLGLKGQLQSLTLQWFGDKVANEKSRKVSLEIFGNNRMNIFAMKNVHTVRKASLPTQTFTKAEYPHLKNLPIEDFFDAKPTILIGLDNAHLGVPAEVTSADSPVAIKTKLGWVAYGPKQDGTNNCPIVLHIHDKSIDAEMSRMMEEYFDTENFGINNIREMPESEANKRATSILEKTTRKIDNRYETGLLWKSETPNLPDNFEMACSRLNGIERKLNKCHQFAEKYRTEMENYFDKGYARILSDDEVSSCQSPVWYLPHFAVKNVHKPEKCRIVFDAAAVVEGVSLNSQLLKGPEQAKPLLDILIKFRQNEIGVAADIKEMFSQVKIRAEDQHAQRFLWRFDASESKLNHCVMTSMIFGAICSPCSAEYIKNRNADNFCQQYPAAADIIVNKHYVDDLVCAFSSEDQAIRICQQVDKIHRQAGFELRNFVSNSPVVEQVLNLQEPTVRHIVNMEKQLSTEKVLGMQWNTHEDVFEYRTKFHRVPNVVLDGNRPPTKRELLSITMAVFDPYGFIADFLLQPKLLMQAAWKCQTTWDEPVPEPLYNIWRSWWSEFDILKNIRIARCYSTNLAIASKVELHVMVDASETAFSAAAYLRIVSPNEIEISFVLGKTRIAPKRLMSMPRLELQAAILGIRISKIAKNGHDIKFDKIIYWSDSRTVIHWIHASERKYKAFVGHRISEILAYSQPQQWRWVPTSENTADAATRVSTKFQPNSRWISGPQFLKEDESNWPSYTCTLPDNLEEEVRSALLIQASTCEIDFNKFSSYLKLKRLMAWVLRAFKKCRTVPDVEVVPTSTHPRRAAPNKRPSILPLTANELRNAEVRICRIVQGESFANEIKCLQGGRSLPKVSHLYKLQPYLDETGLLRLHGRLDEAACLPLDVRRPIVMPRNHVVTELLVRHYHEQQKHQNAAVIINEIRQRFWVPRLKQVLKDVQRKCPTCQVGRAKPSPPMMGQLPEDRVTPFVRPFTYTGVDLFGPINIVIGRRQEKRWVTIFTCLTVRAAHLEVVENLSTDAFILSLRNFINRRGTPVRIRCDNGTNFIGAQRELKKAEQMFDVDRIQREGTNNYIEWIFNCPANPSSGGCWERLIQIVKRLLQHTFKDVTPRLETLRSVLIESENVINSRPLTEVPIESEESEPITPNHFLIGCANSTQTPQPYDAKICLNKQWRIAQDLKNRMWKRWVGQYLPQLLHRPKWCQKHTPLKVNDVVIVCDPAIPRSQWQKGRITQVFPAKDGQIRIVEVKTPSGMFRRPANRVAALTFGKSD